MTERKITHAEFYGASGYAMSPLLFGGGEQKLSEVLVLVDSQQKPTQAILPIAEYERLKALGWKPRPQGT